MSNSVENVGKIVDTIDVAISYKIIELFSAGLYSSPNKAFEELVCNSYDAFADTVAVFVPSDLTIEGASIWVCDNGESMDHNGFEELWKIGESLKRTDPSRDKKRLQIGRFGIGKLATYILTNRLTYVCKKDQRYLAVTMNFEKITQTNDRLTLDEREITEEVARNTLEPHLNLNGKEMLPFDLFGEKSPETWTFAMLTGLKTKAAEISEGRLKWVLSTALPLNPGFILYYNGAKIKSSKISKKIKKKWVFGENDYTAELLKGVTARKEESGYFVDFKNLKGIHGYIELFEDSLVDASKSNLLGRSHGIFLMVRDRLVNLDDPLLGMQAFSHGPFNRSRITVFADELDSNLTSTREAIKESNPLNQLKEYIQKKFNNEVVRFHFDDENRKEIQKSISHRMAQTSLTLSKRPLYVFAEKYFNEEIKNPLLILEPNIDLKEELLADLKEDLTSEDAIIKEIQWEILESSDSIAKFDLHTGNLKINLSHPFIANYMDSYKNTLPLQFIAITEVLTEAHLYEINIDESKANSIMRRRDSTLRELSLSDRESAPAVAQMLKDALAHSTGLENALHRAFLALGFESTRIAEKGKPDGKAEARLGYSTSDQDESYSFTYEAKSTSKNRIKARTTGLATINKHKADYKADYAVVVAVGFEGEDNIDSNISITAQQQKITVMKASDLMRLLLLSAPKQIGLKRIRELLETCYSPTSVTQWIDNIQEEKVEKGPIKEILEAIYKLQCSDNEPPEVAGIRQMLRKKSDGQTPSKHKIISILNSLKQFVPGFISIEGETIGIQGTPDKIMSVINSTINDVPHEFHQIYLRAFSSNKNSNSD